MVDIEKLGILGGYLPPRVLSLVIEWASIHQKELMNNWNDLIKTGTFNKIKPLV